VARGKARGNMTEIDVGAGKAGGATIAVTALATSAGLGGMGKAGGATIACPAVRLALFAGDLIPAVTVDTMTTDLVAIVNARPPRVMAASVQEVTMAREAAVVMEMEREARVDMEMAREAQVDMEGAEEATTMITAGTAAMIGGAPTSGATEEASGKRVGADRRDSGMTTVADEVGITALVDGTITLATVVTAPRGTTTVVATSKRR
jgi:hypothetical protein